MGYDTINFGKHKGMRWEEIPNGYLQWILDNDEGKYPKTIETVAAELERREIEGIVIEDEDRPQTAPQAARGKTQATAKADNIAAIISRLDKLEAEVFGRAKKTQVKIDGEPKDIGKSISFDDDDIPF